MDLGLLWDQSWLRKVTLGPLRGHFGVILGIWTSNGMYDVYSCGFDGVMIRPKRVHKQKILIFAKDFACQRVYGYPGAGLQVSGPDRPKVIFGSLWSQFGVSLGICG